jgi:hypothetical protein
VDRALRDPRAAAEDGVTRTAALVVALVAAACGNPERTGRAQPQLAALEVRIPRAPGEHAPSLVAIERPATATDGEAVADVDTCAGCHPDVAAQWAASAHSFASFGNPIYRTNVERIRADLGAEPSRHCGGCHDFPLLVDGLMTSGAPIPAADLRAHSGVTCRLCHGVARTTLDGNASFAWDATPIEAPSTDDPASIARHKRAVTTRLDAELCMSCHRGFLSPDLSLPVHLTGVDEPGQWLSSAYTGNGTGRIDRVEPATCIDCHMERVPASDAELGAKQGAVASHRFVGGHTWMAAMRGDAEQLRLTRAKLAGAASIDVAGARLVEAGAAPRWHLPADGAPVVPGGRLELDVVIRNLLVGHRFPGGVLDLQDTWVEVEVIDRHGARLAASGLAHAEDPTDDDAHVLRTLVVDEHGAVLDQHEIPRFRAQVATHTIAARDARAVRYAFAVPTDLAGHQLPLAVTARLRHRSRTLAMQAEACASARTPEGAQFLTGAKKNRDVVLDPCRPQPITLVAEARVELGAGARATTARPAWERIYEHGMALVANTVLRADEARGVLAEARARAPDARARAQVTVQLGWVAAKQGRVGEALALVDETRALLATTVAPGAPAPVPAVLDAVATDALVRANRWHEAVAPARACAERAPKNATAWAIYARVLVATEDHRGALDAAARGLDLAPRDPDLLRAQATALAALGDPRAAAAQAAYTRFRAPDDFAALRIRCARGSERCMRDRNPTSTLLLR